MVIVMTKIIRRYSELIRLQTFEERYEYLKLSGIVGESTFGSNRYLNQQFYQSQKWQSIRNQVIIRDTGCDLGIEGRDIFGRIYIHHMNPISVDDVVSMSDLLISPEYLICTAYDTHNAIHYGDENLLILEPVERTKNDTCPWKL